MSSGPPHSVSLASLLDTSKSICLSCGCGGPLRGKHCCPFRARQPFLVLLMAKVYDVLRLPTLRVVMKSVDSGLSFLRRFAIFLNIHLISIYVNVIQKDIIFLNP